MGSMSLCLPADPVALSIVKLFVDDMATTCDLCLYGRLSYA